MQGRGIKSVGRRELTGSPICKNEKETFSNSHFLLHQRDFYFQISTDKKGKQNLEDIHSQMLS